jgi:hypothetical protein
MSLDPAFALQLCHEAKYVLISFVFSNFRTLQDRFMKSSVKANVYLGFQPYGPCFLRIASSLRRPHASLTSQIDLRRQLCPKTLP